MKKIRWTIKSKILMMTVLNGFVLLGILIFALTYSVDLINQNTNEAIEESLMKQVKNGIQFEVQGIVTNTEAQFKREQGTLPDQQLIDKVLDNVRKTLYSTNGYYFVYTYEGIRLVAPENLAQEGKNLLDLTDAAGGKPVQQFIKQAKSGGGFVEYMWVNPASKKDELKVSYVSPLKLGDTEILIGTGTYLPMIEEAKALVNKTTKADTSALLSIIIPVIAVLILSLVMGIYVFFNSAIIKPIRKIKTAADKLAVGDVQIDISSKNRDEIGDLIQSFKTMTASIQQQSAVAQTIAAGDVDVDITVRSNVDMLSLSLLGVVNTLKSLSGEFDKLIAAFRKGDFNVRGDVGLFQGQYAKMLAGVNEMLDESVAAFDKIEAAHVVSEKKAQYQAAEVKKLVANLERIAEGELICDMQTAPSDADTKDLKEMFDGIAGYLNKSVGTIRGYVEEISNNLGEMSQGNLDVTIEKEYLGDFIALKDSINTITESLNDMMEDINAAANQVASGTAQVSGGAQTLSQGATEQASAIEQLTSSIEQIANQTRQNALDAGKASNLTAEARDFAVNGNARMQEMLKSMQEINDASASISKIIKVIDEIAFQTNLLALNAAVEAARAGQYGKGFAVVAEEVRNLAARSAGAAKETSALIEGTVAKAGAGMKTARETAEALNSIMGGVEKASELVAGIAAASNEQATAVAQVSRGIEQVAQVVQSTSATAEESAATSEELSGQAEYLKQMVGRFRLKGGQSITQARRREVSSASGSAKPKAQISLGNREFGKY